MFNKQKRKQKSHSFLFRSKVQYQYVPVQETLTTDELGTYVTYSLSVRTVEKEIAFVRDVSTDFEAVRHLAELCTENQLDPEHLSDVIDDFLVDGALIP